MMKLFIFLGLIMCSVMSTTILIVQSPSSLHKLQKYIDNHKSEKKIVRNHHRHKDKILLHKERELKK